MIESLEALEKTEEAAAARERLTEEFPQSTYKLQKRS